MTVGRGDIRANWNIPAGFRLRTNQLDLVPASGELENADWNDHGHLSKALNVHVPQEWPPSLEEARDADREGWWEWYVIRREQGKPVLIGMAGLKGWPEISGTVQVGCVFLPEFQKRGFGTEAVDGITSWALSQSGVEQVVAHTPAGNKGAACILHKLGFQQSDSYEAELLRFVKMKS